ncbi:CidA/LrgA family protein [Fundicoccus culcitae]|uniref:CidA/LrgA family protein n=1 Tax=Fundicoccus culcitae TaxID=2969821 RepID=A0ABY5P312_9LACT|nr:CidA/LrgA family protein [Fundicoccus culcitae]UUX33122.1 CidA/LrgA family protein [Fundicoccus culcitae]
MKIYKQLFWIFLFSFAGEVFSILLKNWIAIPGSVIGMVLLFLALHYKWIKIEQVETVGSFLTDNMAILFVPAGVGLMTNFDVLGDIWWQLILIILVTTVLMMGFVGRTVQSLKAKTEAKDLNQVSGKED